MSDVAASNNPADNTINGLGSLSVALLPPFPWKHRISGVIDYIEAADGTVIFTGEIDSGHARFIIAACNAEYARQTKPVLPPKSPEYDKSHGSPWDRGTADSYYRSPRNPHYWTRTEPGSDIGKKTIPEYQMTREEIEAYHAGYDFNEKHGDKKNYGREES